MIKTILSFFILLSLTSIFIKAQAHLPVELVEFRGEYRDTSNSVYLYWKTETEINNFGFDVERSIDESSWTIIGFVPGSGTSSSAKEYEYEDFTLSELDTLNVDSVFYRLEQIDIDGNREVSWTVRIGLHITSVEDYQEELPGGFKLQQNYPNPFNPTTIIKFTIPAGFEARQNVSLDIFNALGEKIITLVNEYKVPGNYEVEFNTNSIAGGLPSGVYFYKLNWGSFIKTKKMVILK